MLIPVRCYTCGEILSDKWMPYISAVQNDKNKINETIDPEKDLLELKYLDVKDPNPEKSIEGKILDEMKLTKYCCRRHMISNVHLITSI